MEEGQLLGTMSVSMDRETMLGLLAMSLSPIARRMTSNDERS